MTPNKAQVKIVNDAKSGVYGLPTSHNELAQLITDALLARDHEAEEAGMVRRCTVQLIKTTQQKADAEGWIYLSVVKNALTQRKYFKDLDQRLKLRGIDTVRHVARAMISNGLLKRVGPKVMITNAAREYLTNNEF